MLFENSEEPADLSFWFDNKKRFLDEADGFKSKEAVPKVKGTAF